MRALGPYQVVGFTILLTGTLVYNQIVRVPCCGGGEDDWPEALNNEPRLLEEEESLLGAEFGLDRR